MHLVVANGCIRQPIITKAHPYPEMPLSWGANIPWSHLPNKVLHEVFEEAAAVDAGFLHTMLVYELYPDDTLQLPHLAATQGPGAATQGTAATVPLTMHICIILSRPRAERRLFHPLQCKQSFVGDWGNCGHF